jgi:hypothetical protein
VRWNKGCLSVGEIWHRVGMDITHYEGQHFLTLIDHGPSRFTIWRPLRRQDSPSIVQQLESIFYERGAPGEILTDNDTAFRSRAFESFAEKWGVRLRFRCAHVPSGNGIVERCHRTVKRIAARKECTIQEAVYRYNVSPKDNETPSSCPSSEIYRYELRVSGVDPLPPPMTSSQGPGNTFSVGDAVWAKPPGSRCTTQYAIGHVTKVISDQSVEVDGIPRHLRDLRPAAEESSQQARSPAEELSGAPVDLCWDFPASHVHQEEDYSSEASDEEGRGGRPLPRRSPRDVQPPDRYQVISY